MRWHVEQEKQREIKNYSEKVAEQKRKITEFGGVLDQLDTLESRKKLLWMHIYEHAMEDRTNAYMLFTELFIASKGQPTDHQLNGPILAKYLERMSKANDQILKLAELIQGAQGETKPLMSSNDIYDAIAEK